MNMSINSKTASLNLYTVVRWMDMLHIYHSTFSAAFFACSCSCLMCGCSNE